MDWHSSVRILYEIMDNVAHNAASQTVNAWRNVSGKYKTNFTKVLIQAYHNLDV